MSSSAAAAAIAAAAASIRASPRPSSSHLTGMTWWRSLGSPRYVCAPMVDASELPFRLLTREFGATLCYTPMMHSRMLLEQPAYLEEHFSTCAGDRPLVAQLCGNDPAVVLAAARVLQGRGVDAIDLNLGCPQGIARRGKYGAFLLEDADAVLSIVRALAGGLDVPVTCKIRVLPSGADATVAFALALEAAGASLLTVHGRTRHNVKQKLSMTDWDVIARVKGALKIPVLANGSIGCAEDVSACLASTGVDGVMSSEALLENPALFAPFCVDGPRPQPDIFTLARRYLALVSETRFAHGGIVKGHLIKILFGALRACPDAMALLASSAVKAPAEFEPLVDRVAAAVDSAYAEGVWEGGARGARAAYLPSARSRVDEAAALRAAAVASDARCAWAAPAFLVDPTLPGAWYHRHRPDAYGGASGPAGARIAAAAASVVCALSGDKRQREGDDASHDNTVSIEVG